MFMLFLISNHKSYLIISGKAFHIIYCTDSKRILNLIENESMMSPEEKMIYEIFGGRDTIIKNLMKQFDSDGNLLNANGVAGMDVKKATSHLNILLMICRLDF